MEIAAAVQERRSIKHFDPDHRMTEDEIERLLSLTLLAPTAFNIQHWRFVLARDPELRRRLRAAAYDQAQVQDASLLIVLCADVAAWCRRPERYWQAADPDVQERMGTMIQETYQDNEPLQRDEAVRSCGIAAGTLMLVARDLGYETGALVGCDFDEVARLVRLPADHIVTMLIAVGKPLQKARPRAGQLPMNEVVFTDGFPAEAE